MHRPGDGSLRLHELDPRLTWPARNRATRRTSPRIIATSDTLAHQSRQLHDPGPTLGW